MSPEPMMEMGDALEHAGRVLRVLPMSMAEHALVKIAFEYRRLLASEQEALSALRRALTKQVRAIELCDDAGLNPNPEVASLGAAIRGVLEDGR